MGGEKLASASILGGPIQHIPTHGWPPPPTVEYGEGATFRFHAPLSHTMFACVRACWRAAGGGGGRTRSDSFAISVRVFLCEYNVISNANNRYRTSSKGLSDMITAWI